MPFFDPDPIDPDLYLAGDLGPGRENRPEDRIGLASAIEKKAGAAPHAELGRYGDRLARRFAGLASARIMRTLPPGFLGAIGAAQIRRGTDPDAVVLKNGPTRDALRASGGRDGSAPFAPLPRLRQPVGPRRPNRPADRRALQSKLASLGYLPRVTEHPLFPVVTGIVPSTPPFLPPGGRTVPDSAADLQILLDGVHRFQEREGLKPDALVNPGGPTERALDARNERARAARLYRLETVSREIMDSDAPEYAPITDRSAADSLAGLVVANEVQDARRARLDPFDPLSFRPGRLKHDAERGNKKKAGIVLAAGGRRPGGSSSGSGSADPLTHGRRTRKKSSQEEPPKQEKANPVDKAKGFVAQMSDKKARRAFGRTLDGAKVTEQTGPDHVVNLLKEGGRKRAISDFFAAVRAAGGSAASVKVDKRGRRYYTADDGTMIMYRPSTSPSASVHGRTNEIHILRPGEKDKGIIKIRYPDRPETESDYGPAVP